MLRGKLRDQTQQPGEASLASPIARVRAFAHATRDL
jgi:hypothetical protein